MDREAQAHAQMDYTQWRVNDGTGGALKWSSMAAVLLDEITTEEDPAERDPEVAGNWQEAAMDELWDLKTHCGRGWMCYEFNPALMHILQTSSIPGAAAVYEKVMQVDNSEGVRAHLVYCAVKIGVGVLSARRQDEWEKVLEKRERQRMFSRLEALERGGGAMVSSNEPATEIFAEALRDQLRAEIQAAAASNTKLFDTLRTDIQTATTSLVKDVQKIRTGIDTTKESDAEAINTIRTEIQETKNNFRTDIETMKAANTQLINTLAQDLKRTRELLSADQIESHEAYQRNDRHRKWPHPQLTGGAGKEGQSGVHQQGAPQ